MTDYRQNERKQLEMNYTPMPWEIPGAPPLPIAEASPSMITAKPARYGAPFPIATICGTMRLSEDMRTMADELTRQGYIVLMPHTTKGSSRLANPHNMYFGESTTAELQYARSVGKRIQT